MTHPEGVRIVLPIEGPFDLDAQVHAAEAHRAVARRILADAEARCRAIREAACRAAASAEAAARRLEAEVDEYLDAHPEARRPDPEEGGRP